MRKAKATLNGKMLGYVMLPDIAKSVRLNTGWSIPVVKVDEISHSYELRLETRHKSNHPSVM
ncbi:hypothetical protein U9029_06530 [Escherichia coli]|uniref:hypothetical protein n=1 Tax=Escherichia coli TaxID=562 RepID=UPI000B500343|nr:hypothetical protein [Escherichia coli]WIC11176.1 hypothetical protein QM040_10680 [Escherichia coli]